VLATVAVLFGRARVYSIYILLLMLVLANGRARLSTTAASPVPPGGRRTAMNQPAQVAIEFGFVML
jgi:hypothetical protein